MIVAANVVLAEHDPPLLGRLRVKAATNTFIAVTHIEECLLIHRASTLLHIVEHKLDKRRWRQGACFSKLLCAGGTGSCRCLLSGLKHLFIARGRAGGNIDSERDPATL
jgi:hypothetical protein